MLSQRRVNARERNQQKLWKGFQASFQDRPVSRYRFLIFYNSACTNFWNQEVLTSSSSDLEVPAQRLGSPDSQCLVNQNFSIVLCHWKSNETSYFLNPEDRKSEYMWCFGMPTEVNFKFCRSCQWSLTLIKSAHSSFDTTLEGFCQPGKKGGSK